MSLSPNSSLGQLSRAASLWKKEENDHNLEDHIRKARDILKSVIRPGASNNFYGSYILCCCLFQLKEYSEAEERVEDTISILDKVKEDRTRKVSLAKTKNNFQVYQLKFFFNEKVFVFTRKDPSFFKIVFILFTDDVVEIKLFAHEGFVFPVFRDQNDQGKR